MAVLKATTNEESEKGRKWEKVRDRKTEGRRDVKQKDERGKRETERD